MRVDLASLDPKSPLAQRIRDAIAREMPSAAPNSIAGTDFGVEGHSGSQKSRTRTRGKIYRPGVDPVKAPEWASEEDLHKAIVGMIAANMSPGVIFFHVPNGGKRGKAEAGRLKGMGTLAGIPDLIVLADALEHSRPPSCASLHATHCGVHGNCRVEGDGMGWRNWNHYDATTPHTLKLPHGSWWLFVLFLVGCGVCGLLARKFIARAYGAEVITGTAIVVDGDTIRIGTTRIRLHGIDAPEAAQTCMTPRGGSWRCGADAVGLLFDLADAKTVTCTPQPKPDKYGRTLAVCATAQYEINAAMVCRGMAWAFREYSNDYAEHEDDARRRKVGVWQAETLPAWQYRKEAWDKALTEAPLGKPVVGVKRSGLYHTPWSPYYRKLNLRDPHGKEFFADEVQALAAGYEPPKLRPSFMRRAKRLFVRNPIGTPEKDSRSPCG